MSDELNQPEAPKPALETPLLRPRKESLASRIRTNFIAGVVVAAPVSITAYLIYWFVTGPMRRLDLFVRNFLPAGDSRIETITQAIPGFGVLVALIAIVLLGGFTKNFIGRQLIRTGEKFVEAMPIVRDLHRFFKNVFETALQKSARSFKEVGLLEYPRKGLWAIAFVVGDEDAEVGYKLAERGKMMSVFVPTVPNPTSGFLIYVPRADFIPLSMSIENGAKLIFSLGLVVPEFTPPEEAVKKLERMAEEAAVERRSILSRFSGRKTDA